MTSKRVLRGKAEPGEYLCTWLIPDAEGMIHRIPGTLTLEGNRFPHGWGYGPDVPLQISEIAAGQVAYTFPQTRHLPVVHVELTTGQACAFVDAVVDVWAPQRVNVRASAALIGNHFPSSVDAPMCEATFQVTSVDAAAGVHPISEVSWPSTAESDVPYSMRRNKDASLLWAGEDGDLTFNYRSRSNIGDAYQYKFDFVPLLQLALYEPIHFAKLRDAWLLPTAKILQISTGQPESVTWLQVTGEDERGADGEWQVFAPWITQEPFISQSSDVWGKNSALRAKTDEEDLLAVVGEWQRLESANHPLIETFARDLGWLLDQPARAQGTGARIGDNDSVVPWGAAGEDVHHAQAVPQGVPPERDRGGSRS